MGCRDVIPQMRIWSRGGGLVQSCGLPSGWAMHCCRAGCQMLSSLTQKQQLYHNPLTLPCSPFSLDAPLRSLILDYTHCCSFFPGHTLVHFSAVTLKDVAGGFMYDIRLRSIKKKKTALKLGLFMICIATMKWSNETKQGHPRSATFWCSVDFNYI